MFQLWKKQHDPRPLHQREANQVNQLQGIDTMKQKYKY